MRDPDRGSGSAGGAAVASLEDDPGRTAATPKGSAPGGTKCFCTTPSALGGGGPLGRAAWSTDGGLLADATAPNGSAPSGTGRRCKPSTLGAGLFRKEAPCASCCNGGSPASGGGLAGGTTSVTTCCGLSTSLHGSGVACEETAFFWFGVTCDISVCLEGILLPARADKGSAPAGTGCGCCCFCCRCSSRSCCFCCIEAGRDEGHEAWRDIGRGEALAEGCEGAWCDAACGDNLTGGRAGDCCLSCVLTGDCGCS